VSLPPERKEPPKPWIPEDLHRDLLAFRTCVFELTTNGVLCIINFGSDGAQLPDGNRKAMREAGRKFGIPRKKVPDTFNFPLSPHWSATSLTVLES
jgi:hypothetical protein